MRAILEGRKTQTRRVMNPQPTPHFTTDIDYWTSGKHSGELGRSANSSPYGRPGDRLWVRETFYPLTAADRFEPIFSAVKTPCIYRARYAYRDGTSRVIGARKWKPSIFMPRALSRITLEVVGVRVDRLQEIGMVDAVAEGCPLLDATQHETPREWYAILWDSINGKRPGCAWEDNPWVWVMGFKRIIP